MDPREGLDAVAPAVLKTAGAVLETCGHACGCLPKYAPPATRPPHGSPKKLCCIGGWGSRRTRPPDGGEEGRKLEQGACRMRRLGRQARPCARGRAPGASLGQVPTGPRTRSNMRSGTRSRAASLGSTRRSSGALQPLQRVMTAAGSHLDRAGAREGRARTRARQRRGQGRVAIVPLRRVARATWGPQRSGRPAPRGRRASPAATRRTPRGPRLIPKCRATSCSCSAGSLEARRKTAASTSRRAASLASRVRKTRPLGVGWVAARVWRCVRLGSASGASSKGASVAGTPTKLGPAHLGRRRPRDARQQLPQLSHPPGAAGGAAGRRVRREAAGRALGELRIDAQAAQPAAEAPQHAVAEERRLSVGVEG
jgi:hypothetical protein